MRNALSFASIQVHIGFFGGIHIAHIFCFFCGVLLYMYLYVLSCDAHYDFCIKQCSVPIYLQLFVGGPLSYLHYLCLLHIVVSNTYFVVCLLRLSWSCVPYVVIFPGLSILDCSFGIHFFLIMNTDFWILTVQNGWLKRFLHIDNEEWVHPNPYSECWFLYIDNVKWPHPNPYDYPWFLLMYKNDCDQTEIIIPDFYIWKRKNGRDQTRMIIPDFYIWTRKNGWDQTCMVNPDFCTWPRKNGWDQTCIINPDFCTWTRKNGRDQIEMA